ncbi:MAG: hypothetical protein EBU26_14510 [Verrucomicrobia bacterium]|nr:hypothetical protein [Verrucomicrobiota bacterium]
MNGNRSRWYAPSIESRGSHNGLLEENLGNHEPTLGSHPWEVNLKTSKESRSPGNIMKNK